MVSLGSQRDAELSRLLVFRFLFLSRRVGRSFRSLVDPRESIAGRVRRGKMSVSRVIDEELL